MEKISKIRVVDDLLPDYDHDLFCRQYDYGNLRENYYTNAIGHDNTYPELGQLIRQHAEPWLSVFGLGQIQRVRTEVFLVSDLHSDFSKTRHFDDTQDHPRGYTLSYHWMGYDLSGSTDFFVMPEETALPAVSVPFVRNRLCIFPAAIWHGGRCYPGFPDHSRRVIYTLFVELSDV
jgi:hypothetical protein